MDSGILALPENLVMTAADRLYKPPAYEMNEHRAVWTWIAGLEFFAERTGEPIPHNARRLLSRGNHDKNFEMSFESHNDLFLYRTAIYRIITD